MFGQLRHLDNKSPTYQDSQGPQYTCQNYQIPQFVPQTWYRGWLKLWVHQQTALSSLWQIVGIREGGFLTEGSHPYMSAHAPTTARQISKTNCCMSHGGEVYIQQQSFTSTEVILQHCIFTSSEVKKKSNWQGLNQGPCRLVLPHF